MTRTPHLIVSHLLAVVIKDAAEIKEACRTKVGGYLLRLACAGDVLHLGTVHYPQISRDLKGARCLALGLGLRGKVCRLGRLALRLFW